MLGFIGDYPTRGGISVGLMIGIPHLFLPMDWSVPVAALTLAFIAGIYVGFAIINGRERALRTEAAVAITFSAQL